MTDDYISLLKYMRISNSISQELLAKKIGIPASQLSMIEHRKRMIRLDDYIKALNYLGCNIKIEMNGEDCMKKMNNEILKNELILRDVGYSKDYKTLNGDNIMVWFNTLDYMEAYVVKDMYNEKEYISNEKFDYYEQNYNEDEETREFGYGEFYDKYMEDDYLWVSILKLDEDNKFTLNDTIYEMFDKTIIEEIKSTFLNII